MTTTWVWNSDFMVFKRKGDQLMLKNDINGALVSLSLPEYELLLAYSEHQSLQQVRHCLKHLQIDEDTFFAVIEKAKELQLLRNSRLQSHAQRQKDWQIKLHYVGMKLSQGLERLFGWKIIAECRGNLRFFKFFSINLEGSIWQKWAESACWQKYYWVGLVLLYLILIGNLLFHPDATFAFSGFAIKETPAMALFLCLLIAIFGCLFCHEMGHYFVYKRYQGEGDVIGLGCMFVVFPVLYTQIDDSCWWPSRRKRMLLSLAGVMMDALILLILTNLLCFYHQSNFLALILACLFYYYVVQILSNLNPFFPGTDGYYLMEDALGLQRCYGHAFECAKKAWAAIRQGHWPKLRKNEVFAVLYFCLSAVCISLYWLLITGLLTFPLWSNLILHT